MNEEVYAKAIWAWLRSETIFEPQPEHFQLDPNIAKAIKEQCQNFFNHEQP